MKYSTKSLLFCVTLLVWVCSSNIAKAQQYECFLYGSITTVDGDIYEGPIRWNDEEVFLSDMFNSEKIENPYIKYLDKTERKRKVVVKKRRRTTWYRYEYYDDAYSNSSYGRKFSCRFGDIKSISVEDRESVIVELKDGKFINLEGGSNDIGNKVWILDQELGLLKIDWRRIDVVQFYLPKKEVEENFGEPIYGKITTTIGEFTGFIQWDHDERLSKEKLDGTSRDGEVSISFSKIKSITKIAGGSTVELLSGRKLDLKSSNDVTSDNRGIIVTIPEIGRIDFPWKAFVSLQLINFSEDKSSCFSEYPKTKRLYGRVKTSNEEVFEGVIVYDLDEAMDAEILNGLNNELEFNIPFRNIKKIVPKAHNYCQVELRNGESLFLGDQTDVSDKNAGILIFTGNEEYKILKWRNIEWIEFN